MKLNFAIFLLCFVCISLFAIGQKPFIPQTHLLKIKEKLKIDNCKIQFLKVVEDSRCPTGAQCIVLGTVSILLRVNGAQYTISSTQTNLNITLKDANYKIQLLDVIPYPTVKQNNDFPIYKSMLSISKT